MEKMSKEKVLQTFRKSGESVWDHVNITRKFGSLKTEKWGGGLNTFAQYSITYDRPEVFASFLLMKNPAPCCECFSSLIDQYMMNLIIMWLQGALLFVPTCSKCLKPALYLVNIELHLEAKEPDIFLIKTLQLCGQKCLLMTERREKMRLVWADRNAIIAAIVNRKLSECTACWTLRKMSSNSRGLRRVPLLWAENRMRGCWHRVVKSELKMFTLICRIPVSSEDWSGWTAATWVHVSNFKIILNTCNIRNP